MAKLDIEVSAEPIGAKQVEVRVFSYLKKVFDKRGWPSPVYFELEIACSAVELAQLMDLPLDELEGVFINGKAKPLDEGWVEAGDRIAFTPPGVPGPYRYILGLKRTSEED
ncbi:hypothetical protein [Fuchsiella alkaliacetigena]|uniref:hypothetical protein n=1 Tax=Fuchsiella alkaliacetigena TaxID=957042 RepID=UPI00200A309F|nr:hypothetical protein [Fuchsiella alkaliacetigena]MCK8824801.1 hypothetical protein [Fuchsiella alkaliacetigena]